jgi:hypothetical protein
MPHQGTVQNMQPQEGSSWWSRRVITVRTEQQGRKGRPLRDITSTADEESLALGTIIR